MATLPHMSVSTFRSMLVDHGNMRGLMPVFPEDFA